MKTLVSSLAAAALLLGTALPSIAQQSSSVEIPGYLNPKTGAFRPNLARPTPDAAPKLTAYTGTLEFTFTIDLVTTVPSGDEVKCEATAALADSVSITTGPGYTNDISEEASNIATIKGATATCTVKIPYSWDLGSGPEDSVYLRYDISIVPTAGTSGVGLFQTRDSAQYLAPIPVPKTGTTTTKTIEATI